jgi:hypothetical protein
MPTPFDVNMSERLSYEHDKFVNRVEEWRLVVDKTARLASGVTEERRAVIFRGARGSGKSWLLQEIKYQLRKYSPAALAVYVSLSEFVTRPSDGSIQAIIRGIDGEVAKLTHFSSLHAAHDLVSQAGCLIDNVRHLPEILVLLLDHVDESPDDLLAKLEDHCLSPLIVEPKVLIVLAGFGKQYIWKGPELRLKSEERILSRFDPAQTLEQLRKQSPSSVPYANDIYALSDGYPWLNYLLRDIPASRTDTLRRTKEILFGSQTRSFAQPHLEALCILRAFDENRMPAMFAVYHKLPAAQWSNADCRNIRSQLTQARFAFWDKNKQAYVLDPAIQAVLENLLLEDDRPRWIELHCAAYCLYKNWAARYPRTSALWQAEADYHARRLQVAGYPASVCDCTEGK